MRTAEQQCGRPTHRRLRQHAAQIVAQRQFHQGTAVATFLRQRHQQRARPGKHLEIGSQAQQGALVGAAAYRALGGQHQHPPAARCRDRRRHGARLNHAEHRQRCVVILEDLQRHRGGGIAGNHQGLDAALDQNARRLDGIALHGGGALGAVGKTGGVAQVHKAFVRQRPPQRRQHRQPAHAGIEHADGRRINGWIHGGDL